MRPVKVLHINQSSVLGGAAVAVQRLHHGLLERHIESDVLAGHGDSPDPRVHPIGRRFRRSPRIARWMTAAVGLNYLDIMGTPALRRHPAVRDADVIHLHNLHGGFLNYRRLPQVVEGRPVVLTLHDMWAFSGHCAHSFDCGRWAHGCGECPYPEMYPAIRRDGTRWEWGLKRATWDTLRPHVIAPSNWLYEKLGNSMLAQFPRSHLPHGIDTKVFRPFSREKSRWALGLPPNGKVILAASQSFGDPWKGMDLVVRVVKTLRCAGEGELVLVLMGRRAGRIENDLDCRVVSLGYVANDRMKALAFSAADVFLHCARAEAFGLVVQESLACGTPVAGFSVGGMPDQVRSGENGWLVEPFDVDGLSDAVAGILDDASYREYLGAAAREVTMTEFGLGMCIDRHLDVYSEILGGAA